jgi:hypothetical protein
MKNSTKAIIIVVGIVAAITGAWLWYFSPANSEPNIWPKENFSQDLWKSLPVAERYKQVRDLFDRSLLTGRSTAEAEGLLGKPSYANPDDAYWTYVVKERIPGESGFDSIKMIHIDFNSSKHVTKVWVRGD